MSNQLPEGGPAFPFACQGQTTAPEIYYGMTLRDYFAAKAMQGMLGGTWPDKSDSAETARRAFTLADEMLKARAQ